MLLLGVALIGLTLLALKLGGAAVAAATGVLVLNGCLLVLVLVRRPAREQTDVLDDAERWRPRSFRRMPEPPGETAEDDERVPELKAHRL